MFNLRHFLVYILYILSKLNKRLFLTNKSDTQIYIRVCDALNIDEQTCMYVKILYCFSLSNCYHQCSR